MSGIGVFDRDSYRLEGFYRGEVVSTADPEQSGRVRVRVFGVFNEDIEISSLPWAVPAQSVFTGSGSGYGCWAVPEVGSHVFVFFEKCDVYQPVYFAEAPSKVYGQPSERTTSYPTRKILKTKSGITIYVDDTTKTIDLKMPSGGTIHVGSDGSISISADVSIGGAVEADGAVEAKSGFVASGQVGVSGTFTSNDGKTITVVDGIITRIL